MHHTPPIRQTPITKAAKTIPITGPICTTEPEGSVQEGVWRLVKQSHSNMTIKKWYSLICSGSGLATGGALSLLVLWPAGGLSSLGGSEIIGWVTTMGLERFLISHWHGDTGEGLFMLLPCCSVMIAAGEHEELWFSNQFSLVLTFPTYDLNFPRLFYCSAVSWSLVFTKFSRQYIYIAMTPKSHITAWPLSTLLWFHFKLSL